MDINYSYYDINLVDIWLYEQSLFLSDKTSDDLAKKIIDKVEAIIIIEGKAAFGINYRDNKDEKIRMYYDRNKREHGEAYKILKERFRLDFFFNKYSCFQYDEPIIINSENIDFDFWFALKIRQYNSKTLSLIKFLDSQLVTNFNNDIKVFISFLKFGILKDQSEILLDEVKVAIDDWINRNNSRQVSNKNRQKMDGEINSFLLKNLDNDSTYFKRSIENRQMFYKVFLDLKKHKFIASDAAFDNFTAIFSNKQISKKNKITWVGTYVELQWLVKNLVYHSQKVQDLKKDIWFVTIKCFVNLQKVEFTASQLRDAKGKNFQRKVLLEEILSKI